MCQPTPIFYPSKLKTGFLDRYDLQTSYKRRNTSAGQRNIKEHQAMHRITGSGVQGLFSTQCMFIQPNLRSVEGMIQLLLCDGTRVEFNTISDGGFIHLTDFDSSR